MVSRGYRGALSSDTPLEDATPCGYCRVPFGRTSSGRAEFEVDHIVPQSLDSRLTNEVSNLVWACIRCNRNKGGYVAGYDEQSAAILPLFNPRKDGWFEHFVGARDGKIHGRTGTGRATAHRLVFNSEPVVLRHRKRGFEENWWPAQAGWLP